jgi:hypothetical protein
MELRFYVNVILNAVKNLMVFVQAISLVWLCGAASGLVGAIIFCDNAKTDSSLRSE